jgi:tyrosyl-tRNA synthetase
VNILDFVATNTTVFPSKGEARKMILANGFSVNKEKFTDANGVISSEHLLHNTYIVLQKGKKQYYVVEAI